MTKEEVQKLLQILEIIKSPTDIQQYLDCLKELCIICKIENLGDEIQKKFNECINGNEKAANDFENLFKQVIDKIYSQIPDSLIDFFYFELIDRNLNDGIGGFGILNDEQIKKAEEIYDEKIEEILGLDEKDRIEASKKIKNKESKVKIVQTLSDSEKIEAIKNLGKEKKDLLHDRCIKDIMITIANPKTKIELLDMLGSETYKVEVIKSININDPQIRKMEDLSGLTLSELTVYLENIKIGALEELQMEESKVEVIKDITNLELRFKAVMKELKKYNEDGRKIKIIKAIEDEQMRIDIALKELEDDFYKDIIMQTVTDRRKIMFWIMDKDSKKIKDKLLSSNPEEVLDIIEGLEGEEYKEVLKRLYKKNHEIIKNIDFRILGERYLEGLGEDKINLITCYPEIQQQILELSEKEFDILAKCIEKHISDLETDEWTPIAGMILNNLKDGQYSELIENIDDIEKVDIEKLSKILQLPNVFDIKNAEDIKNYEEIKRKKCEEIINSSNNIEEKKNVVLLSLLGCDVDYAKEILRKYGGDINSIEDGEEKDFVLVIKEILELTEENVLKKVFNECEGVGLVSKNYMERKLKTAYGKQFNEGLYETRFEYIIEEENLPEELKGLNLNVYDAGTDFKMIITSIGAYAENVPGNFKDDWNRPAIGSQHFCACYIRNDMLAHPPIRNVCYGFSNMKEDALILSGYENLESDIKGESFVVNSILKDSYWSPDKLINKTRDNHNEIDFRRIQNGQRKQPDYIVAFRENGTIDNLDKIIKTVNDWEGKLPIVIVDVDKCLETERAKLLGNEQNKRRIRMF